MKEYIRIRDIKEPTFDSLEKLCNQFALNGWVVINITNGDTYRTATLEREIPHDFTASNTTNSEDNWGQRLQAISPAASTGNGVVKRRPPNNKTST